LTQKQETRKGSSE